MEGFEDLSRVNLNLLVSLQALLEHRNVTQAAASLNLTQSAMSRNLSQLRELFGDPLLVRSGASLVRTPRADQLHRRLEGLLSEVREVIHEDGFDPRRDAQEFIIAAPDYPARYVLSDALAPLYAPDYKVRFRIVAWDVRARQKLILGELHLAISLADEFPPNIFQQRVDEDNAVCVMRREHPLAGRESLSLEDLAAYPHALVTSGGNKYRFVDRELRAAGLRREVKLRVASYSVALAAAGRSDLLLVVPNHVAVNLGREYGLCALALPFASPLMAHSLWWHERFHFSAAHKWLREQIFESVRTHPMHLGLHGGRGQGGTGQPGA